MQQLASRRTFKNSWAASKPVIRAEWFSRGSRTMQLAKRLSNETREDSSASRFAATNLNECKSVFLLIPNEILLITGNRVTAKKDEDDSRIRISILVRAASKKRPTRSIETNPIIRFHRI